MLGLLAMRGFGMDVAGETRMDRQRVFYRFAEIKQQILSNLFVTIETFIACFSIIQVNGRT